MARQSNLNMDGAVRLVVTIAAVQFVPGSNNGAFVDPPVLNGAGDTTINLWPGHALSPGDVVEGQIEVAPPLLNNKAITVERVSPTQLRVRTFLNGIPTIANYALNITRRFRG